MPRYRADEHHPYFCTVTVLNWVPVLIEARYLEPIIDSLRFCREHRGLQVLAYVVMPNHAHLIVGCDGDLHALMRDFKRFTSRAIHDRLKEDGRCGVLDWLGQATQSARRQRGELGFWQDGFRPEAAYSQAVFQQKLSYLHDNPVRKGLVISPQDWWYGSARNYAGLSDVCMPIDPPDW